MGNSSVAKETLEIIDRNWEDKLEIGLMYTLSHFLKVDLLDLHAHQHINKTPKRYIEALKALFSGCSQIPEDILSTKFESSFDQMIHVEEIEFFSMCAHHLLPFTGTVHFAYIPDKHIVGLSKIPRLVDMYAKRPQIQEEMADQIVDNFQRIVEPAGCGIYIRAAHFCCSARGVKKSCFMKTTALRGCFKDDSTKSEFLQAVR